MVIFATIFFSTVFRLTNFLSLASAACNSARNSCETQRGMSDHRPERPLTSAHLYLAPREELGILAGLGSHGGYEGSLLSL